MIHFKTADESDSAAVAEMLADLFGEVGHDKTAAEIAAIFADIEGDERHSTLLALDDDDDLVGLITLTESIAIYAGGRIGVINELYVAHEWRSEGVGAMLVGEAKSLAQARNWQRLEVTTPGEDYERTIRFYEREGFFRIGPRMKCEL